MSNDTSMLQAFYRERKIWAGMAFEASGAGGAGGARYAGVVYALGDPIESVRFGYVCSETRSIGLKLGGSGVLLLLIAWGFNQATDIDIGDDGSFDWDFDLFIFRGQSIAKYLRSVYTAGESLKGAKHLKYAGKIASFAETYDKQLQDLKFLLEEGAALVNPSRPNLIALPIFGGGLQVGLGVKASIVQGADAGSVNFSNAEAVVQHLKSL